MNFNQLLINIILNITLVFHYKYFAKQTYINRMLIL